MKKIGLGYLRSTAHGKPIGSLRLSSAISGGFLVYLYASGSFLEIQLYSDDPAALHADLLSLGSRLVVRDRIGVDPCAPDPVVAPHAVPEPVVALSASEAPCAPAAGMDAFAAMVEGLRAENAHVHAELARLRDENAAVVALAADLESRLHAIEGAGRQPEDRMLLVDFLARHGIPRPAAVEIRKLGKRVREAAIMRGHRYDRTTKIGLSSTHPVAVLDEMLPELRAGHGPQPVARIQYGIDFSRTPAQRPADPAAFNGARRETALGDRMPAG